MPDTMTAYGGYMGRVLLLDLTHGTGRDYPWSDKERELYIGGKAMASRILYDNLRGTEEPFGADNWIVIATGPLTGTAAPSSNRFNISALSPLTGITSSSNCGGDFGSALKRAGYDALILTGACAKPTWIEISEEGFFFRDAASLWGMRVTEAQGSLVSLIKERRGQPTRCGIVSIGPAGENLVRYASVISGERAAGRGGLGAVFGSKKLKAIVAWGGKKPVLYDPEGAKAHHKKWIQTLQAHPNTGGMLPRLGTAGLVSSMQVNRQLSTRNFSRGSYERFEEVSGEALAENLTLRNRGCPSCPIQCTRRVKLGEQEVKGPELETLVLLGGNLENPDLSLICRWNHELDELGMDTISCAGTVAWAMEASEKGLWDSGLRFGDTEKLSQVFEDIAFRRGIGAELAEGSKRLSEKYGGKDFAIQSKGMELAAYEPRRSVGQGLGYAVSNRGGCHLNGGYLVVLEGLGMRVNAQTPRGKADLCMFMQDLMESISMGGQCLFTSYAVLPAYLVAHPNSPITRLVNALVPHLCWAVRILNKWPEIACFHVPLIPHSRELQLVTGMPMTLGKFLRNGERSYNIERAVNARFGVSAASDKLPKRLTDVPQDPADPRTRVPLEEMKRVYYRARGWGREGLPDERKLKKLGIRAW